MLKRVVALALIFIMTLSLTSCTFFTEYPLDKYRVVDYGYDEEADIYYLEYKNERYIYDEMSDIFGVDDKGRDPVYLGWLFNLPHARNQYYSYSTESPDYIYLDSSSGSYVFFKESVNFDLANEIFVLEDIEIKFCDTHSDDTVNILFRPDARFVHKFRLTSKKYNALYLLVEIYQFEDKFYMYEVSIDMTNAYQISDAFLESLIEKKIIVYT